MMENKVTEAYPLLDTGHPRKSPVGGPPGRARPSLSTVPRNVPPPRSAPGGQQAGPAARPAAGASPGHRGAAERPARAGLAAAVTAPSPARLRTRRPTCERSRAARAGRAAGAGAPRRDAHWGSAAAARLAQRPDGNGRLHGNGRPHPGACAAPPAPPAPLRPACPAQAQWGRGGSRRGAVPGRRPGLAQAGRSSQESPALRSRRVRVKSGFPTWPFRVGDLPPCAGPAGADAAPQPSGPSTRPGAAGGLPLPLPLLMPPACPVGVLVAGMGCEEWSHSPVHAVQDPGTLGSALPRRTDALQRLWHAICTASGSAGHVLALKGGS